jgi:hypothetical protein
MRNLCNRLVHEYMTDSAKFVQDLLLAQEYSIILIGTYNCLRQDSMARIGYKTITYLNN